MSTAEDDKGRKHTMSLRAYASMFPLYQKHLDTPRRHENYSIHNIGTRAFDVEVLHGTEEEMFGILTSCSISPGEERIFDLGEKEFYVTALKIYNRTNERAHFHAGGGELVFPGEHYWELLIPDDPEFINDMTNP
ncbi:hypothetical protein JTB14_019678 [Gonioctena quinquepunctata]|nr:hypothetical protein JTB14_019678 [Gonioctena quinquepunctata]